MEGRWTGGRKGKREEARLGRKKEARQSGRRRKGRRNRGRAEEPVATPNEVEEWRVQLERLGTRYSIDRGASERPCLTRQEGDSIKEVVPNELKFGESGKGDESWPSARRWRR